MGAAMTAAKIAQKMTLVDLIEQVRQAHVFNHAPNNNPFNLPQFYWIKQEQDTWQIEPFGPQCATLKK